MPRRIPVGRHWDANLTRNELLWLTRGQDIAAGPVTAHVAAVPLFRTATGGGLEQAVRVRLDADNPVARVEVSLRHGDTVLDRASAELASGSQTVHLFLPEVTAATPVTVVVTAPAADPVVLELVVEPQRKWTISLIHHSHFDYGYTDPQAVVMDHQLQYIDAALDLVDATDGWSDDSAFRWNIEVTYPFKQWLANRPAAARDELFRRVKAGRIEINALPFSMHTEVYSIDELAWGLRFTDELRERYGIEIVSAIQSDVPGATLGLLNLLTAADIKYLSVAHNYAGRSIPFAVGGQDLTRPFWWRGGDGKRLLVWQADTPHGVAYMEGVLLGLADSATAARRLLPEYLKALAERPYPYSKHAFGWHDLPAGAPVTKQPYPHDILHLRMQNGLADNAPPSLAIAETVRDWNAQWAYPRLRLALNRDFFESAETRLGDRIATHEGDWTDWWVDGVGAGALPLGLNRRAQAAVRTGQTLHALADVSAKEAPAPAVAAEIDRIYEGMALFDEHTWGSANPWNERLEYMDSGALQWGRKSAFAYEAFDRANTLLDAGLHRFTASLSPAAGAMASLAVFNPSGWTRSDLARVFVPAERLVPGTPFAIVESETGRVVPYEDAPQAHPGFRAKGIWVTFPALDLPPVGYRRYDLLPAEGESGHHPTASDAGFVLESRFYRVEVDPREGHITSIVDRETGRELVDPDAPYGFNEYIYDRYTSAAGFNHLSGRIQDVDLTLMGDRSTAGHAALVSRTADAVAERLTIRLTAAGADWLETTIVLPHDVKRIEIENRLAKIATLDKESVYFAFPFAVDAEPEYEICGGVTSQSAPHVPGSTEHMFAVRHWVTMADAHGSAAWATLEAPLIELGTIALPFAPFPSTLPADRERRATIYSWALNNIWDTNFPPDQGGEMLFRYAIGSAGAGLPRELGIKIAAAFAQPLAGLAIHPRGSGALPASASFVQIDDPAIEVVGIAPARNGGLLVLLHSLAAETTTTVIRFPTLAITRARLGNFLERNAAELAVEGQAVSVSLTPGALAGLTIEAD